jgi:hypothetical protein
MSERYKDRSTQGRYLRLASRDDRQIKNKIKAKYKTDFPRAVLILVSTRKRSERRAAERDWNCGINQQNEISSQGESIVPGVHYHDQ